MRTTLELDQELLSAAQAVAEAQRVSLDAAVSQLLRLGLERVAPFERVGGFVVFPVGDDAPGFGLEEVRSALAGEGVAAASKPSR